MKRFIHRGYFTEVFLQLRTAGIVMASILMLLNVAPLINNVSALIRSSLPMVPTTNSIATNMMLYIYVASLVLTFISYNWLNHRSTSDFYHALPIKRSKIYWSTFLAVSLWIVIAVTGYAIVHALLYLFTGMPFNYLAFLCVYLNMLIGVIQVVGVVSLACALSGTRFVNLFSAAAILLVPRVLLMVLALFVNLEASYLPVTRIFFLFDPSYNIFATPYMVLVGSLLGALGGGTLTVDFCSVLAMLYSLVHACLLAFLGCIAFKRRPSEAAGMPMKNRFLQAAIRTAFGLPLLLILVLLLNEGVTSFYIVVVLVLFSFVIYCLYELISTKSAKRMLLAMPLFTICIGIAALYLFVPKLIGKAAASIKLDKDDIASVEFAESNGNRNYLSDTYVYYSDEYQLQISYGVRMDDPKAARVIANAYKRSLDPDYDGSGRDYVVRIERKSGRDLVRNLTLTGDDIKQISDLLQQNEAYVDTRTSYPKGTMYYSGQALTLWEARELGNLFREEFNSLSKEDRMLLVDMSYSNKILTAHPSHAYFILNFRGVYGTNSFSGNYAITDMTPKTAQRYAELLEQSYGEHTTDDLHDTLKWMETGVYPTSKDNGYTVYAFPADIQIGNCVALDFSSVFYRENALPKNADPEYYEILKILLDAELTGSAAEGTTVRIGNRMYEADYDTLILSGIISINGGRSALFNLKLSDEQFAQITELYEQHETRLNTLYQEEYDKANYD